ncbi:hypothetical protein BDV25DRAFT_144113 [Aspergillus avenaceus]|uniref:Uncharacterized protein n=1 Tax=Aspergillus avenaceus TaxID=36643 RepID=A0A5N6TI33_ASPAV|nr:hypothetical protein BDV25DRAFT_144113 [Aspergillus avenaceus]
MTQETYHVPPFRDLEIRGTWDGEPNSPAELRISFEVLGVPATRLQVLDLRDSGVSLGRTSVQLISKDWDEDDESDDCPPQSPLFDFFGSSHADSNNEAWVHTECRRSERYAIPIPTKPTRTATEQPPMSEKREYLPKVSPSPQRPSSRLQSNFAKRESMAKSPCLRKRSATDACFADSESESNYDQPDKKEAAQIAARKLNSSDNEVCELDGWVKPGRDEETNTMTQSPPNPSRDETRKPNLRLMVGTKMNQSNSEALVDMLCMQTLNGIIDQGCYAKEDTTRGKAPMKSVETSGVQDYRETELTCPLRSSPIGVSTGPLLSPSVNEKSPEEVASNAEPTLTSTEQEQYSLPNTEQLSSSLSSHEQSRTSDDGHIPNNAYDGEYCHFSVKEPSLNATDGILYLTNPGTVSTGAYKVIITTSIALHEEAPNGWFSLTIPGLPELKAKESGFILFLIPDKWGMEFRTTNLQRYQMIDDCLFAEFVHKRNLVLEMRTFDQRNYGIIKDFVLDHEIKASYALSSDTEDEFEQPGLLLRYHAMCSLRLHGRCFWAKRCCFYLHIDGGPEGFFQCKLQPPETGLQMIHIPTDDPVYTGVSRIQVICAPQDLHMFCLTWLVKIPPTTAAWLPQIYPASSSCSLIKNHLRNTFTKLYSSTAEEERSPNSSLVLGEESSSDIQEIDKSIDATVAETFQQPVDLEKLILLFEVLSKESSRAGMTFLDSIQAWMAVRKGFLIICISTILILCACLGRIVPDSACLGVFGSSKREVVEEIHSFDSMCTTGQAWGYDDSGLWCSFSEELFPVSSEQDHAVCHSDNDNSSIGACCTELDMKAQRNDTDIRGSRAIEEQTAYKVDVLSSKTGTEREYRPSIFDIDYWLGWRGLTNGVE